MFGYIPPTGNVLGDCIGEMIISIHIGASPYAELFDLDEVYPSPVRVKYPSPGARPWESIRNPFGISGRNFNVRLTVNERHFLFLHNLRPQRVLLVSDVTQLISRLCAIFIYHAINNLFLILAIHFHLFANQVVVVCSAKSPIKCANSKFNSNPIFIVLFLSSI